MSSNNSISSGGVGLFGFMFLILFALKLAGPLAELSWWWVTAPLWGPILLVFGFISICLIIAGILLVFALIMKCIDNCK